MESTNETHISGMNAESEIPPIQEEELFESVKKVERNNAAPGPDDIPGRVLAAALRVLGQKLLRFFNVVIHEHQEFTC